MEDSKPSDWKVSVINILKINIKLKEIMQNQF